jgi:hypothetical protein
VYKSPLPVHPIPFIPPHKRAPSQGEVQRPALQMPVPELPYEDRRDTTPPPSNRGSYEINFDVTDRFKIT